MGEAEAEGRGGGDIEGGVLEALLEEGKAFAAEEFLKSGRVNATAIVLHSEEALLLAMDPEQPPDREEFREAILDAVRQTDAHGVCVVAEIWYDTFPLHAEVPVASLTRGEALLVCAEDHTGRSLSALSPIVRADAPGLGEWKILSNLELHGVSTGFFRERPRTLEN